MHLTCVALLSLLAVVPSLAYDTTFAFAANATVETRTLDEIYQAALAEGGVVTLWHGGDERNQQDSLKTAFEAKFPGMTLNVTVDVSKYHDQRIDEQLATNSLYVDSAILQTLHDYPRWKQEGALLNYQPVGFEQIHPAFKDIDAAYYGLFIIAWSNTWNTDKLNATSISSYADFLRPEFKDKLVLTYPNDDDAVLFQFHTIMQTLGKDWFEALLQQNPRWVRGTGTPATLVAQANNSYVATFTSSVGLVPSLPLKIDHSTDAFFTSWPQTGAIFRDAPHPEGAKLLHNFLLTVEHQNVTGTFSTRIDVASPGGYPFIFDLNNTNPTSFGEWMGDRAQVERFRFWIEDQIGTAQGLSPLIDDL
ncbi:hypothetical protein BP5796_07649 [Coleophoma crateriformis]|uniref:ABC-type Fe3+ transport system n=1 Tax=Coleophoma crateriformis TaxID=565419 RepID=A0A3D8RJI8_9HELO|nr:hypothetical protein BP5796_07649 [Coleophoma crateriformis]